MRVWLVTVFAALAAVGCGPSAPPSSGPSDRSETNVEPLSTAMDASPATLAALDCALGDSTMTSESAGEPFPSDTFANETDSRPNAGDGGGGETRIRAIRDVRMYGGFLRWIVSESGEEEYVNWFVEGDPDAIAQAAVTAGGGTLRKIKDSAWSGEYQIYVHAGSYDLGTPISLQAWLERPHKGDIVLTTTVNPTGVRFSCGGVYGNFPYDFE